MGDRTVWDTIGGILFFFLWPLYLPVAFGAKASLWILGIFGLGSYALLAYSRTVGWLKMKLGLWQPIAYTRPHSNRDYGTPPRWVNRAVLRQTDGLVGDKEIELAGRSFRYRVKVKTVGKKMHERRYYRKLNPSLVRRATRLLLRRWPETYTEALFKLSVIAIAVYIVSGSGFVP